MIPSSRPAKTYAPHANTHAHFVGCTWLVKDLGPSKSMSEEDPVVTLNRPGHDSLEVRRSQISLSTLSRSFGVSFFLRVI